MNQATAENISGLVDANVPAEEWDLTQVVVRIVGDGDKRSLRVLRPAPDGVGWRDVTASSLYVEQYVPQKPLSAQEARHYARGILRLMKRDGLLNLSLENEHSGLSWMYKQEDVKTSPSLRRVRVKKAEAEVVEDDEC